MKIFGIIGAALGLVVAIGAAFAVVVAPSLIALGFLLLGLLLFFVAAAAARRSDPVSAAIHGSSAMSTTAPVRREPDSVKLSRSAAKLGVELPAEAARSAALNEDAAKDALREIIGKRTAR